MKYLLLLVLVSFSACGVNEKEVENDLPPGKVRLKVDDIIIERGNLDEIMLPLTWWVGVTDSEELYMQGLRRFSNEQRLINAALAYLKEAAEQGHFHFFNSTNKLVWTDALNGLGMVGLKQHTIILQRALEEKSKAKLEDVDFENEDVELLNLNEKTNPHQRIIEYIKANKKGFYYEELVTKP